MGASESILHDGFSIHPEENENSEPSTLPTFALSASSRGGLTSEQPYVQMSNLSQSERNNIGATLSLLLSRSATSSNSTPTLPSGVSPLLLSSDVGLGGMLDIIFGSRRTRTQDPTLDLNLHRSTACRGSIRPRVLGLASESTAMVEHSSRSRRRPHTAASSSPSFCLSKIVDEFLCPICLDIFDRPVATPCRHVFCVECMVNSLVRQSICPLCRSAVYVHMLRPLSDICSDPALKQIFQRYQDLIVECPRCAWIGSMALWDSHVDSGDCRLRRMKKKQRREGAVDLTEEHQGNSQPGRNKLKKTRRRDESTNRNSSSTTSTRPTTGETRFPYQVDFNLDTADIPRTTEPLTSFRPEGVTSNSPSGESSTERLALWIVDNNPGVVVRLYVVSHRMENTMGAIGGIIFSGVEHTQAILEFERHDRQGDRQGDMQVDSQGDTQEGNEGNEELNFKVFIAMEIFADRIGAEWEVHEMFPPLKSTASRITVYDNLAVDSSVVVDFLLGCRHRRYNLLGWNCQTFISDLRKSADISELPSSVQEIPRPCSYSEELMQLLNSINTSGTLPTLNSYQLASNSTYRQFNHSTPDSQTDSPTRPWIGFLVPKILRRSPASPTIVPTRDPQRSEFSPLPRFPQLEEFVCPQPPLLRVRSVTLCLFPAEDLHRSSLRPAAELTGFWSRTFGLVRPAASTPISEGHSLPDLSDSPQTYLRNNVSADISVDRDDDPNLRLPSLPRNQIRLRYSSLPVLVLQIQSIRVKENTSSSSSSATSSSIRHWETLGYLSLEFRSDCGLWWHLYHDYPPGLLRSEAAGGTDKIVSSQTSFPLSSLRESLMEIRDKQYHPTSWSGWEFVEAILRSCCPSVAHHFLNLPLADDCTPV